MLGGDLAVDDDMGDMHALGPQLARHALGERAQAELADRQIDEVGAAAQRCRGAGEEDAAAPLRHHGAGGLAADQEAAEAADAPAALELLGRGIDDRLRQIGAGVVDDHGGLAEIALHGGEELEHGLLVAGIAAIAAGTGLLGDRRHALPIARGRRHQHAGLHEPPAQRRAQPLSGTDDDRHFVCCHPVPRLGRHSIRGLSAC